MAEDKTNWISWILQGLLGLVCGLFFGFELSHSRSGPLLQPGCTALFVWGAIMLGVGIATIYGDQLWMQFPNQTYPPEKVASGRVGKFLSHALCVAGAGLIAAALIKHWMA